LAGFVVALERNQQTMKNTRNSNVSLSFLLCAVTLHWLNLTGFAQPSTNQVLSLNGTSAYVTIPSAASLQNSNAITVEAWIYANAPQSDNNGQFMVKGDDQIHYSSRSYEMDWFTNGSGQVFSANLFLNTTTWAQLWTILPASNWVHVAFTFDSASGLFQLFTNGVLATNTTLSTNTVPLAGQFLRQTTLPLNFGGETIPEGPTFVAGYMDEVSIWNTNRTAIQIAETRFCRLTGTESNLVGYWNFDNSTANDLTTNGNNGTLEGGAVIMPNNGADVAHEGVCGEPYFDTATASAVVTNGFIIAATITDGGNGYTNTPAVRIIGGGGCGAQAVDVVSNGVVIAIDVLDAGSGYTNTPVVVIDPPFILNPVLGIAPMSFLTFSNLTVGGAYQLQQLAQGYYWTNQPVDFTATNSVYAQMVSGVTGSGDYRLALSPVPSQAFAVATVDNGFVVGAIITSGGSSYITSPTVSIDGYGTNAGGFSEISGGVVTNIVITNAGFGYTNTTMIEIGPPPAAVVSPTVQLVMQMDSASLAPYDNYQIQFTPTLGATWENWDGGLFSPTDVTNTQYLFVTNTIGFFRLGFVP
jgi:hypothetical protein